MFGLLCHLLFCKLHMPAYQRVANNFTILTIMQLRIFLNFQKRQGSEVLFCCTLVHP